MKRFIHEFFSLLPVALTASMFVFLMLPEVTGFLREVFDFFCSIFVGKAPLVEQPETQNAPRTVNPPVRRNIPLSRLSLLSQAELRAAKERLSKLPPSKRRDRNYARVVKELNSRFQQLPQAILTIEPAGAIFILLLRAAVFRLGT